MTKQSLDIAPPPQRKKAIKTTNTETRKTSVKFDHIAETDKVQFNRYVPRATAEGYEILAVKTRQKVPELLTEALELLEQKYGRV